MEDCRFMLRDAPNEIVLSYDDPGKEVTLVDSLIEQLPVEVTGVGWMARGIGC